MANNIALIVAPALDEDGWVFSSLKQVDRVMAWYLASNGLQSTIHRSDVSSYANVVQQNNNNRQNMMTNTENSLTRLLGRYVNNVVVVCTDATAASEPSLFLMAIQAKFQLADGSTTDLVKLATVVNGKMAAVDAAINGTN